MNILTDVELEQRAAAGESEAFGVLYERYSPRVYDFLVRMMREPAEAADLMQETFVRAMRSLKAERAGKAEFVTWLFTIARNLALTRLERSARTTPLLSEPEDESFYYGLDPDLLDNPESIAQASEIASLVWEASEALEPKQRTLLDLHVRQGLDSAQIATVLGVSKGNAYTMVSRLKDTFESAVAALVMFRAGRRNCPELNQLLEVNGVTQVTPDVRKMIEAHTKSCDTCQGRRRELVSASSLLRAFVPLPLLPEIASRVRDGAWAGAQQAGPAGVAGISAHAASASHSGGLLSTPTRVLRALPGPSWLPAVAAIVLVAVAVPAAVLGVRASGGGSGNNAAVIVRPTPAAASTAPTAAVAPPVATMPDAVSVGELHACMLQNGSAWCWGADDQGQLGNNSTSASLVPVAVSGMASGVTAISAGGRHTCAVKDGAAECWGENSFSQLGNGRSTGPDSCVAFGGSGPCSLTPMEVTGMASGVTAISTDTSHTCAVKNGGAWCWGSNPLGQLGNNTTIDSPVPVAVPGMADGVTAISAGSYQTCLLKSGGVWCWGLGIAHLGPVPVPGMQDGVSAISAGAKHTCALKNGGVWCWGYNFNGELGNKSVAYDSASPAPVAVSGMSAGVSVISSGDATCAIKNGSAWCWGDNTQGQLGIGTIAGPDVCTAFASSAPCSAVPVAVSGMSGGVTAISGRTSTCALKDGAAWCWGANVAGELGNGSTTRSETPVAVLGLPVAPTVGAPTPASTSAGSFDGTYVIVLPSGDSVCGTPSISGLILTVQGATATITTPSDDVLRGDAVQSPSTLSVHISNQQNTWTVELTASLDPTGGLAGQSKNSGIYPGGQQGFSCGFPFTGVRTAPAGMVPGAGATTDTDRLRAAIAAHEPGIGFDPECVAQGTQNCATGSWSDAMLASGIASVVQGDVATFYGRKADGTWAYWFGTQNTSGGPQVLLPGDMIVCAGGDGLNLRSGPSTSAPVVTLIPDGTVVRGDTFVMTDPSSPGGDGRPHPDGWYHITSPQEGWAYDRYLLGVAPGVQTCIKTWWP